jgi:predicted transcriptional regulator
MQKSEVVHNAQGNGLFEATLGEMVKIFSAIANEDSMRIFFAAKDGIESSTKVIMNLGLTQKRYYTRLKELLDAGLIQKEFDSYQYTMLGKICYKLGSIFMETLNQSEKLELIDKVKKFHSVERTEKDKIIKALVKEEIADFSVSNFFTTEDLLDAKKVLKVVFTYEDLVKTVCDCYDRAEKLIKIASRYTPSEVAEKVYDAVAKGIKMEWIDGDKANLSAKLQIIKTVFTNPRAAINFYQAVNNPGQDLRFYHDLPYCLMIVDGKFGALEVPDPITGKFLFAIFFEDVDLCKKLDFIFCQLKEKSTEHPYKEIASKFNKIKI